MVLSLEYNSEGSEQHLNSGCILKVEPKGFSDVLGGGFQESKELKMTLINWRNRIAIKTDEEEF
jgi:hypothetical protein